MKGLRNLMLAGLTGVALMLPALPTIVDAKDGGGYKHTRRDDHHGKWNGRHGRSDDHRFNRHGNYRRGDVATRALR